MLLGVIVISLILIVLLILYISLFSRHKQLICENEFNRMSAEAFNEERDILDNEIERLKSRDSLKD